MSEATSQSREKASDEVVFASALRMAELVRDGQISARELLERHLARIDEVNPLLNAVVTRCDDMARETADAADEQIKRGMPTGPLHGVPFTVKDGFDTAGVRTTAATEGWAERVPAEHATVVQRVVGAGAILIGKTNTPELTLAYSTDNQIFGRSFNPYDPSRSPGGSSGGAAAIVAAGGAAFDIGSDTGGSIRLPAHFCGIAAIKPSAGLVPRTGLVVGAGSPVDALTQVGPLARTVEDARTLLELMQGPDWRDSSVLPVAADSAGDDTIAGWRVAYFSDNGDLACCGDVAASVRTAAEVLAQHGADIEETRPAGIEGARALFGRVFTIDGGAWIRRLLSAVGTRNRSRDLDWIEYKLDRPRATAADYTAMLADIEQFRSRMLAFMRPFDLLLAPTHPYAALPHDTLTSPDYRPAFGYTQAFNLTGWPSVVVRTGATRQGLPIGIQVIAPPWRDRRALDAATLIEAASGGWRPPAA